MPGSVLATDLIGKQVFTGKKPDPSKHETIWSKTVRIIYYGTDGLKAVVEDYEGNLEQVNAVEMRIPKKKNTSQ